MRVALISDIHANLPALDAVLAEVDAARPDAIYHLGDLIGYAPWPNDVVERVRTRGIPGVGGNYDTTVALDHPHCGCQYDDPLQQELSQESYAWTRSKISVEHKTWLGTLPFRLDLRPVGGHTSGASRLVLVHGTPNSNVVYWTEDRSDDFFTKMAGAANLSPGDIIAFGHTHKPFVRELGGVTYVNTGSVGKPKDGDPRAGYVWLDLGGPEPVIEVRRVVYDVALVAAAIRKSPLPDLFGHLLESGGQMPAG